MRAIVAAQKIQLMKLKATPTLHCRREDSVMPARTRVRLRTASEAELCSRESLQPVLHSPPYICLIGCTFKSPNALGWTR